MDLYNLPSGDYTIETCLFKPPGVDPKSSEACRVTSVPTHPSMSILSKGRLKNMCDGELFLSICIVTLLEVVGSRVVDLKNCDHENFALPSTDRKRRLGIHRLDDSLIWTSEQTS